MDAVESRPFEECLAVLAHASELINVGALAQAEQVLGAALMLARQASPEDGRSLFPLTIYYLTWLRQREKRDEEAKKFRDLASTLTDQKLCDGTRAPFAQLMASVLMNLEEYRRAIPFWEEALEQAYERNASTTTAEMLWRAGECYNRNGAKDHAAVLLRAAEKRFRGQSGDPRLPAVLVALGNALRKSAPVEAEKYYREAAEIHEARGQLQSATTSWVNLGVLCSEQGRHAESLEHYQRVLKVREQSPGTPVARIGAAKNNLANCYRRMGRFTEAHASVDRAIELLKASGSAALANAYGTRGQIYLDAGNDELAVEWSRKARAEHRKAPSPHYDSVVTNLENEIAALKRLGRENEAAKADEELQSVRAAMESLPKSVHEIDASNDQRGAVLIELDFGSHPDGRFERREAMDIGHRLASVAKDEEAGNYSSRVTTPESTTLIFYGEDAEKLYRTLEPSLLGEKICSGARVMIRQGGKMREVILPSQVM